MCKADSVGYAENVRVHGDGGHAEGIRKHHAGGLAADSRKGFKVLADARHPAAEFFIDIAAAKHYVPCLSMIEPAGTYVGLDLIGLRLCHGRGIGISRKERGRDLVDLLVGALRGEYGRDKELVRIREIELRLCIGMLCRKARKHGVQPFFIGFVRNIRFHTVNLTYFGSFVHNKMVVFIGRPKAG